VPDPDGVSVLTAATRYLFENLLLVRGADLSAPTPCRGWDLRRLLRHLAASLADVADVLAVGEAPGRSGRRPSAAAGLDPVAALRTGVVDFLLTSASPPTAGRWCEIQGRPLPADVVVYVGALEMVLHAWDIAQACRADRPIPTELASALLCVSPPLAEAGLAGRVFAEPLTPPPTAAPSDQLLALFGRQPLLR
jgi:uncharacterized protein (TIGR03086 family)